MAKIDHHLHTSRHSPDSMMTPEELVGQALAVGLDGVVITEHDYQWPDEEVAELSQGAAGLAIFSGAEVSTRSGHFLVYGLPDLNEAPPGLSLAELLDVVRRHDAAIVAAHPYRWEQPFDEIIAEHGPVFDALEVASKNVTPEKRRLIEKLLRRHPTMGSTGSSDSHEVDTIGCYYTEVPGPIASIADFVTALRRRATRPRHREGAALSCGPIP